MYTVHTYMSYLEFVNCWVKHSLLKVCQWLLRNSIWDAFSLETIMRFEGYEGKYLTSSCIYYWFRTLNGWRTQITTYIHNYMNMTLRHCVSGHFSDDDMDFSSRILKSSAPEQHEEPWLRFKDYRITCWGLGNTLLIEI